jgi:hypothetical protein
MNVSPLFTQPLLRNILPTENYVQNPIALVSSYLPILHFEMVFSVDAHFQSPKVSVEIALLSLGRARKRQKPQSFMLTFANSQPTHQPLKSPSLFFGVNIFALFNITPKIEIKPSRRQFLGD